MKDDFVWSFCLLHQNLSQKWEPFYDFKMTAKSFQYHDFSFGYLSQNVIIELFKSLKVNLESHM